MRLNEFLRSDLVLTDLAATDVAGVIDLLADHLHATGAVASADEVRESLMARERAHSTVMGQGMALPHATIPGLDAPVLMVALASPPVQFGPPETEPVTVFFVLLSPPGHESRHIKLLARICRLMRHPGFIDELRGAPDGARAVDVIERVDEQHV
jgi:mannitol/fructose-specific phosphotransferase system IIA component (Ntr-type)